jgi:UDP-N-acetylglucosamine 1-carboxyvinyltransferase
LRGPAGIRRKREPGLTCIFQADNVNIDYLHSEKPFRKKSGRVRGLRYVGLVRSWPRFVRKAFIPKPVGLKLAAEIRDTHIFGLKN